MKELAVEKEFRWDISPADSPWRQGKVEKRIGVIKRLLKIALGDARVSPLDLQTILFEVADICNNRPISVTKPREDGTYVVLTPNHLVKAKAGGKLRDDKELAGGLKASSRYHVIQQVTEAFWKRWAREVTPGRMIRKKWHEPGRDELCLGDVVLICEAGKIKNKYKLAVVEKVEQGREGKKRSAVLRYRTSQAEGKSVLSYCKPKMVRVCRSVQRLALLVKAMDFEKPLMVEDKGGEMVVREAREDDNKLGEEEGEELEDEVEGFSEYSS